MTRKRSLLTTKRKKEKSLYSLQKRYPNLQMCRRNIFPDLRFTSTIGKALAKKIMEGLFPREPKSMKR